MSLQDNLILAPFIEEASAKPDEQGIPFQVMGAVRNTVENRRISNNVDLNKNWDFYQGNHEDYFEQRRGEDDQVFEFRKKSIVKPNYCKFIIDISAKYSYGRNDKIRRQFILEDKPEFKKTEDRFRRIDKLVGYQALMLEAKRNAGLFGEQPIRLIPVDELSGDVATSVDRWTYPHPILLDPRFTFCLVNSWGKIQAIVIEDDYIDYINNKQTHSVIELIVSDSRWRWIDGILVSAELNTYKLSEEFICFFNDDTRKDELQYILDLQIKLDESLTDQAHFFEKHGWPQLVTSVDLSNVVNASSYIWEIQDDDNGLALKDKMQFLTWDGKPSNSRMYAKDLEAMIFKISATAPIATGDLENIGQLRSGAALVASHAPSIQKAQEKQVVWERNERNLFMAIASLDSNLHNTTVENRFPGLDIDIRFPDDFVPGEELVRSEIDSMAMQSHTVTIKDVARRKHPEYKEEDIIKYREEIILDSEQLTDSKNTNVSIQSEPISSSKSKSIEQPLQ